MKTFKFNDTEVKLSFESYRNNGTLAILMNTVPDDEPYAVITVNLCCPLQTDRLAFVDENNLPGIGAWLKRNKIATPLATSSAAVSANTNSTPSTGRRVVQTLIKFSKSAMAWRNSFLGSNLPSNIRLYFATDGAEVVNTSDNIRLPQFGKAEISFFFNPKIIRDG